MRRFLPSLSALQAFEAAARHLSFTRAAEDLMLTQSGISRHINHLETQLGVRLFERTGSRLVLTDAGRVYAEEVRQNLDRLEEISIDAVRGRKASMSLMLGAPSALAARWLMPRLPRFAKAFPGLPVEVLDLRDGAEADTGKLDIAITRGVDAWGEMRARPLFREQLAVVASPGLMREIGPVGELLDCNRVPTLQNARRPSLWLAWLRASGVRYEGAIQGMRFSRNEMLIRGAVEGLGMAVVPWHYVTRELEEGSLVLPFGAPVPSGETYWIAIPETRAHRPELQAVRDWLLGEARSAAAGCASTASA
ncbi:LysR substrate-binding domain-containing protein [Allosediminivita pacifica]|uniref:DNA-binding transcriptional LysR family regulator n=1 Tax=Allosediminivita pacifica TaxID=1267769 RepID=A0A2T6ASB5_9RHOB|nr:LysR substrate-binding domain-containing protein [Allosediminivita pacifica]PTX46680.1 DNA-binding transcriptional LysR family regulator [Allosediminivita pacifica]GGB16011.1 LysR family transcriptional regulator [Allosediminivita pacifica]